MSLTSSSESSHFSLETCPQQRLSKTPSSTHSVPNPPKKALTPHQSSTTAANLLNDQLLHHTSHTPFIEQFQQLTKDIIAPASHVKHPPIHPVFLANEFLDLLPELAEEDSLLMRSPLVDLQLAHQGPQPELPLKERIKSIDEDHDLVAQRWFEMARGDESVLPEPLNGAEAGKSSSEEHFHDATDDEANDHHIVEDHLQNVHDIAEALFGETRIVNKPKTQASVPPGLKEAFAADAPVVENTIEGHQMTDSLTVVVDTSAPHAEFSAEYSLDVLENQDKAYKREEAKTHSMMHAQKSFEERKEELLEQMRVLSSVSAGDGYDDDDDDEACLFERDIEEALDELERTVPPLDASRDLLVPQQQQE